MYLEHLSYSSKATHLFYLFSLVTLVLVGVFFLNLLPICLMLFFFTYSEFSAWKKAPERFEQAKQLAESFTNILKTGEMSPDLSPTIKQAEKDQAEILEYWRRVAYPDTMNPKEIVLYSRLYFLIVSAHLATPLIVYFYNDQTIEQLINLLLQAP